MSRVTQRLRAIAVTALVGGAAFLATPAQAWWHGGVFIGVPPVVVAPAPVYPPYYYPPAYYPPAYYPPAYYPPPAYAYPPAAAPQNQGQYQGQPQNQSQAQDQTQAPAAGPVAYGAMCYAGPYQCAAPAYTPVGQTCSCPGLGAPSYGSVQ